MLVCKKPKTMAILATCAFVLGFVYYASCEQVVVRGPLHDALIETMRSHPSVRKVTIDTPELRVGRFYLPKKTAGQKKNPRRKTCRWTMAAKAVGDYDVDKGFAYMTTDDCAKYSVEDWLGVFPCVFDKQTLTTTCNGELPQGANQEHWHIRYLLLEPNNKHAPLKPAPSPRPVSATPFKAEPTLISLGGLSLAKAIQYTGVYSGSVLIQTGWQGGNVHVEGESPGLSFDADFMFNNAFPASTDPQETRVSWYAWAAEGNLVVDMLYGATDVTSPTQTAAQGVTSMPMKRATVSYSAKDLAGSQVTIDGTVYTYRSNENGKTMAAEPRLCPVLTLSAACSIVRELTDTDKQRLGNITGFFLTSSGRNVDSYLIAGNVLGTKGLLNVNYRAAVVDPADHAWIELPLYTLSHCAQRVYGVEECVGNSTSGPQIGPLVYDQSYDLEGGLHDILPTFTAF